MVLGNSVYRDSQQGVSDDFSFDLEARRRRQRGTEGWFSESSVGEILWDLFDPANDRRSAGARFRADLHADDQPMLKDRMRHQHLHVRRRAACWYAGARRRIDDLLDGREHLTAPTISAPARATTAARPGILPIYKTIMLNSR
jgi:hypothetical protein